MMNMLHIKETTALNKKELLALLNEAYYDIDYGMSDNAKMKGETRKYLNQSLYWLEELHSKLKKEIENENNSNNNLVDNHSIDCQCK